MGSKWKDLSECLDKLFLEVRKAEDELAAAEATAETQAETTQQERKRRDSLLQDLHFQESRNRSLRHQLKKCQLETTAARLRNNLASKRLAELDHYEYLLKEKTLRLRAVVKAAERRMKAWDAIQLRQRESSQEEVELIHTRQEVDTLRDRCRSLILDPRLIPVMKRSVSELKQQYDHALQQASERKEKRREYSEIVSRTEQDVRAYRRRREEYVTRLRMDIEQESAHNAHIASDLSKLEAEVCKMKDALEARRKRW